MKLVVRLRWSCVFLSLRPSRPSSVWMRKWFHLLALLVYLPGVALDPDFLGLMASLVAFVFVVIEVCVCVCVCVDACMHAHMCE